MNIMDFLNKYQDLELGEKTNKLEFIAMDYDNYTKPQLNKSQRKELSLSNLLNVIKRFSVECIDQHWLGNDQ